MVRKTEKANGNMIGIALGAIALLAILAVAYFFLFMSGKDDAAPETASVCLPDQVTDFLDREKAIKDAPSRIAVYLDASAGMRGYVNPSQGSSNIIANFITETKNYTRSGAIYKGAEKGQVDFYRFDKTIGTKPLPDPEAYGKPAVYTGTETRITDVLALVAKQRTENAKNGTEQLTIIVTDLMLDDTSAADDFEASVGGELRTAVTEDNLAIGILGLRVPFDGPIYHAGKTYPAKLRRRPLIMLMIGQPRHVRSFHDYLSTSETKGLGGPGTESARRAFAMFGQSAGSLQYAQTKVRGTRTGFRPKRATTNPLLARKLGTLQQLNFDKDKTENDDAKQGLSIALEANATVAPYEVIGDEPRQSSRIWQLSEGEAQSAECFSTMWVAAPELPKSGWKTKGQKINYLLTADTIDLSSIRNPGTYLVQLTAGQAGLVPDHPAASWMTSWSMSSAQITANLRNRREINAPGLEPLRRMLTNELIENGRETVTRSVSHFVLEVE